jgi:hypothetical protein
MKPGIPTPVRLIAYKDRTFTFRTQTPPTAWFLKKCANIDKGSAKPVLEVVGKVTAKQIFEIARIKQTDSHLKKIPLEHLCRSIAGSARSMGLEVIAGKETPSAKASVAETQSAQDPGKASVTKGPVLVANDNKDPKSKGDAAKKEAKPAPNEKGKSPAVEEKKKGK